MLASRVWFRVANDVILGQHMKKAWLALLVMVVAAGCTPVSLEPTMESAQQSVRPLSWTGTGRVYPPGRVLELGVSTHVTPFVSARSDTWVLAQGPSTMRTMIIEPTGGWLVRGGKQEPMPEAMLRQEREQFAIYGQMQMAMAQIARASPAAIRGGVTRITIPARDANSVDTQFMFDPSGRLIEAGNAIDDSDTPGKKVEQRFRFSGEVVSNGLRWPRRLEMFRGGKPYFTLDIATFTAGS
jgi:hypothetical protein